VSNKPDANRRVIDTRNSEYEVYDFGGPKLEDIGQLDLSYDRKTGHGAYMIRMQPGAETTAHRHDVREEYLILEGDLVEPGGLILGPGDYIIYEPGSVHSSRTVNGCLLVGFDYNALATTA
jgi:mannose-6-phosphate isomerase-like protein (cupin superfamily)